MSRLTVLLTSALLVALPAFADEARMNAEIDFLLQQVGNSGCVFIRNGDEHDARKARDHLAMKRRRGHRYYDSADEFIEKIASRSSFSGKPYHIRCNDEEQTAADWFGDLLAEFRASGSDTGGE